MTWSAAESRVRDLVCLPEFTQILDRGVRCHIESDRFRDGAVERDRTPLPTQIMV